MKTFKTIFTLILFSSLGMSLSPANAADKTDSKAKVQSNVESESNANAKAMATYYLVRHAEKQSDGTKNPHLTEQGQQRADYLAQQLSLTNISKIYSTDYHRTQETAKPLSDLLDIKVESYNPSKLEEFAEALKAQTGRMLIVGHSNTTPNLAAFLSGEDVEAIDESQYENLYQVVLIDGKASLNRFRIFPIASKTPTKD